jgi:hypothetical protein
MKQLHLTLLGMIVSGVLCSPLAADDTQTAVKWDQLCNTSSGQQLVVSMTSGEKLEGYCVLVTVDALRVQTSNGIVVVARSTVHRLHMYRPKKNRLASLGKGMKDTLRQGVDDTFSPMAPVGLILIPGTLAWGAVAAPFCILGDIATKLNGPPRVTEIVVR